MQKFDNSPAGQKRAKVTQRRKGKNRNDTSDFEFPDNAAGRLATSFWGFISPNGFRSQLPGAGRVRAMQRRAAEQANRERGVSTERAFLDLSGATA